MLSVGIPKEIKEFENRVSLIPSDVKTIIDNGIIVYFQKGAGNNSGYYDYNYIEYGAIMVNTLEELYKNSKLIVKVKEPQEKEYNLINENHTIFTFFHFASNKTLLETMINSKAKCYAYETIYITKEDGKIYYPILSNMSSIAGDQAFIEADVFVNKYIPKHFYYIPITIIGVGNVGISSMNRAISMGYKNINLIDNDYEKIKNIKIKFDENEETRDIINVYLMNDNNLKMLMRKSIITIGCIYNTGERTNKLLTNEIMDDMPHNSIIMDVAIDQGGITEQSKPTTKDSPYVIYKNVTIYCVPNIPSCVPQKASKLLSNSIINYVISLANNNTNMYPELELSKL
jgi:alanine dehydrogenase